MYSKNSTGLSTATARPTADKRGQKMYVNSTSTDNRSSSSRPWIERPSLSSRGARAFDVTSSRPLFARCRLTGTACQPARQKWQHQRQRMEPPDVPPVQQPRYITYHRRLAKRFPPITSWPTAQKPARVRRCRHAADEIRRQDSISYVRPDRRPTMLMYKMYDVRPMTDVRPRYIDRYRYRR